MALLKSKKIRYRLFIAVVYLLCTAGAILFILPFLWMVSTSLKDSTAVFTFPPKWIPQPIKWSNYPESWTLLPFTRFLINTCIITFSCIIGQVVSAALVAYGFARIPFKGNRILFLILISTMMLPGQVTMIPSFLIFKALHWIDTFKPLIVPAFFGGGAFFIFLLRQFFLTIPRDLDEAATIDGCNKFDIFWRIILPLSKPALATVVVFSFIGHWNDFMGPLIYLNSEHNFTLAVGLNLFQGYHTTAYNLLMAASLIVLAPVLIIFFLAQRYFIEGITLTGIKG
ncbi:MAG: carbohydrate ABC transporter permease [bacterium]|nr:carbohydrate ABC transporter permease [bacterium]